EALDRGTPEGSAALEGGFLVPRETRAGVRYVRSRKKRRHAPSPQVGSFCLGLLVVLTAAAVGAIILLTSDATAIAGWQLALGFLYPLQLALDFAAVARTTWGVVSWLFGDLELELSADRVRVGIRCGPLWLNRRSIRVADLKRLVIVKRPEGTSGTIWELVAERKDGSPEPLLSADDPGNVIPIARDLYARIARREELCDRWPALAEEDRPAEIFPDGPARGPLLPGGGWTWLAIHAIGSVGLWQVLTLPWFQPPRPTWPTFVWTGLVVLQVVIFLANILSAAAAAASPSRAVSRGVRPRAEKFKEK
ncbi:MAG TPA: hypothetical protein VG013_35100, partial [Gemmataceae bacterium]|nr:hypothetical protein [Gemmataceae bacterium]